MVPAVIASALVAMICLRMSGDPRRFTLAISAVVIAGLVLGATRSDVLLKERNFFGVREVQEDARNHMRILMHGTTKHGGQSTDPARRREPPSYHNRQGPLGDIFNALPSRAGRRVAVIGLGTGAMAAYAGAGEEWVFYEIDPDIARVARDARYFTYLQDTPPASKSSWATAAWRWLRPGITHYDLIFIDAFSSDAIPTHLLTFEALSVYRSKLSETGVLVLHLSNRYLDLEPVLGRLVQATGIAGLIRANTGRTRELLESGGDPSIWAAVASRASFWASYGMTSDGASCGFGRRWPSGPTTSRTSSAFFVGPRAVAMTDAQPTSGTAGSRQAVDRVLPWLIAGSAAAVILVEIVLTRLFSVLLYYHYSFLAVALALFGLAAGGFSASRCRIDDITTLMLHLRELLRRAAIALLGLVLLLVLASPGNESVSVAVGAAMMSAVPLYLLGKTLALAMALGRARIHRLYAIDLVTSAAAALLVIPLLARVQGPLVLAVPALVAIALDAVLSPARSRFLPAASAVVLATALVFAATRTDRSCRSGTRGRGTMFSSDGMPTAASG